MKFGRKYYYKPTPEKIQKIADAVLAACVPMLGYSWYVDNSHIAVSTAVVCIVAKFFSEFFKDDVVDK